MEEKVVGVKIFKEVPRPFPKYVVATETDKAVALKYFQALEEHECSWDCKNQVYTADRREMDIFYDSLTPEELHTPLATLIITFGSWAADMQDLCLMIYPDYKWERLVEKRKEWDAYEAAKQAEK